MWLFAGLGNPGRKYRNTRHNAGFSALEKICQNFSVHPYSFSGDGNLWEAKARRDGEEKNFFLLQPLSYMNLSGDVIKKAFRKLNVPLNHFVILYDDYHLPLGRIRFRRGGASGGHRGMESIMRALQSRDILRVRIGVGPLGEASPVDFVLGKFSMEEQKILSSVVQDAPFWIESILWESFTTGMNQYNGKDYAAKENELKDEKI